MVYTFNAPSGTPNVIYEPALKGDKWPSSNIYHGTGEK